jgi:5-methylcytosine-specific restriction endonuclease McrA
MSRLHSTYRWQQRSKRQLAEHPLCQFCWQFDARVTPATVSDHIEPHHGDPEKFWSGALMSLCKGCHDSRKQRMELGGYMHGTSLTGDPIDPNHPWNRKQSRGT